MLDFFIKKIDVSKIAYKFLFSAWTILISSSLYLKKTIFLQPTTQTYSNNNYQHARPAVNNNNTIKIPIRPTLPNKNPTTPNVNSTFERQPKFSQSQSYTYYEDTIAVHLYPGEMRLGMAMGPERDIRMQPARINDILPGSKKLYLIFLFCKS